VKTVSKRDLRYVDQDSVVGVSLTHHQTHLFVLIYVCCFILDRQLTVTLLVNCSKETQARRWWFYYQVSKWLCRDRLEDAKVAEKFTDSDFGYTLWTEKKEPFYFL